MFVLSKVGLMYLSVLSQEAHRKLLELVKVRCHMNNGIPGFFQKKQSRGVKYQGHLPRIESCNL